MEQQTCRVFIETRGVQARIRERIPTAQYVHSKAHVSNLVIVHSSSDVSVRTMVDTVPSNGLLKIDKFEQELCRNDVVKDKLSRQVN